MPYGLRALRHPRQACLAAAEGSLLKALLTVALSGLALSALGTVAAAIGGRPPTLASLAPLLGIPLLTVIFWGLSGRLVDAGARLMERSGQRRRYLAASSAAFPILTTSSIVAVLQALLSRAGASAEALAVVGFLSLAALGWYLAVVGVALSSVYDVPGGPALALALLPFAVIAAAVLLYVLIFIGLHGAGLV